MTIEPFVCTIPLEDIANAETIAFNMLGMDRETVEEEFDDVYEDTRAACLDTLVCKGMAQSFRVESIDENEIRLEGGVVLESRALAEVLHRAEHIVMYALTVHEFEALANNPANDMFESMFYNAWGVGYSIGGHAWIKQTIATRAHELGLYAGRGWTPGEEDLELSLQRVLFECIDPSQIGIRLLENGMMRPVMTVSGFMGLSSDPAIEQDGADKTESH